MNKKIELRFVALALIVIIMGLCVGYLSINFVMRQYDAARLAMFANRISSSDHIVVTWDSVRMTFTGGEAQRIVRAVSSAVSARMPNAELALKYSEKATFYKGTNVLGHIAMADSLFLLNPNQPPFGDGSRTLDTVVSTPLYEALRESYRTNH